LIITVNYILEHPLVGNPQIYNDYIGFILTWMDKTPEYTFNLNDKILTLCKDDNLLLFNVYLACLAKTAIETKKNDVPAALKLLVIYLERTDNKVRRTSKIKKMIQDVKEGKVEKYI